MDDFTSTLTLIREGKTDLPVGKNGRTELADEPLFELRQYISALEAGYRRLRHFFKISKKLITAKEMRKKQGWIDPDQRLPEQYDHVLVVVNLFGNDVVKEAMFNKTGKSTKIWQVGAAPDISIYMKVKYWMPYPTPPEERD